jgi:Zn-dependent protease with chaperone function
MNTSASLPNPATISPDRRSFPNISAHCFEHPLDKSALLGLRKVPGLDWVVRKFVTAIGERRLRLLFMASAVRVNNAQFPKLHRIYQSACETLDIQNPPELFVTQKFAVNAAAIGVDKPFIMLTSSALDMFDDDEIRCILGHELGHVMCGHALYTTVLMLIMHMWYLFVGLPGGAYAVLAIRAALLEWSRKAELSADRAGLLVSQDPQLSYRVDMKLAGGSRSQDMSVDEFIKQADDYEQGGDLLDGVLKLSMLVGQTHPFPVLRVKELKSWVESGDYDTILKGDYQRRDDQAQESWLDSMKDAAKSYQESFTETNDPLMSTLRDLSSGAISTSRDMLDFLTGIGKSDESEPQEKK